MRYLFYALLAGLLACAAPPPEPPTSPADGWRPLFNGRDLSGWTPKVRGYPAGVNYGNTFRVEDGLLKVRYDSAYDGRFAQRYGHLFTQDTFSHYQIRAEYRFAEPQIADGEGWATRNSGLMLHGQRAERMGLEQDFPISLELQLLARAGDGERPTANLCTPGTEVDYEGEQLDGHCLNSGSATYPGGEWVTVRADVYGDSLLVHYVNGEEVLRYTNPRVGGGVVAGFEPAQKIDGTPLRGGTISLQSESHPVDFRRIEIRPLR